MQKEITEKGNVLKDNGTLATAGYSTRRVLDYNREAIKTPWKIKEWDFYQVSNDRFCIQFTIGHVSYAGTVTITAFDIITGKKQSISKPLVLPFNRLHMPRSAEEGDLCYKVKGFEMSFTHIEGGRKLYCKVDDPKLLPVEIDITLDQPSKASIVMATPFDEGPNYFYYNHKINCMPASGKAVFGIETYDINPDTTIGLIDWGRGVWPYKHEWFWSNGSSIIDGKLFGFNLGYGFGNTSAATENMLFYDGSCHKLEDVSFNIPKDSYTKPWTFSSSDKRFEMEFIPVFDNYTETKMLFVNNHCHQVFGRFNGKAVLDDGRIIEVKNLTAFAEHAVNRW